MLTEEADFHVPLRYTYVADADVAVIGEVTLERINQFLSSRHVWQEPQYTRCSLGKPVREGRVHVDPAPESESRQRKLKYQPGIHQAL